MQNHKAADATEATKPQKPQNHEVEDRRKATKTKGKKTMTKTGKIQKTH
jgi:hypothetical protein